MIKIKRYILSIVVALWGIFMLALPVYAISGPDSGPFLTRIDIYRHALVDDDMLVVARYNLPYTVPPDETISEAYIGRFMDGSDELGRISPYSYYNSGYGTGLFSIYLDADSAPTWEGSYAVELNGSPTLSWSPSIPTVTTTTLNWRSTASSSATEALLYAHLIAYAEELSDDWSLALTTSTTSGMVFSSYGEAYFTNAIPELRSMSSSLFSSSVDTVGVEDVNWQPDRPSAWPFNWTGMSGWLGLPTSSDEVFRNVIGFIIIFALSGFLMTRTNRIDIVLSAALGLLIVAGVTELMTPVIVGGFVFLAALVAGLVFIFGKATG